MATDTISTSAAEILLVVQGTHGVARELVVGGSPSVTVGELVDALVEHLGLDEGPLAAFCARTQTWLDEDMALEATGLLWGDRLVLSERGNTRNWGSEASRLLRVEIAELVVLGGPASGLRVGLTAGEHILGRDDGDAEIAIEDPSLSRQHARLIVTNEALTVADLGSTNGTAIDGAALPQGSEHRLRPGEVVEVGRTLFAIESARPAARPLPAFGLGILGYNRPPRIEPPYKPPTFDAPEPPDPAGKRRLPLAAALLPVAMGGGMFALTGAVATLLFMALAPIMAVWTFLEDRRGGRKTFEERRTEFRERLAALAADVGAAREQEARARRHAGPSASELLQRAQLRLPTLWERRLGDADFLELRIGSGDQLSAITVKRPSRGSAELLKELEQALAAHASLFSVPALAPLGRAGALGLAGPADRVAAVARLLVASAATLHSPRDLVVAAAVPEEDDASWSWLRWLPHSASDTSPIEGASIGVGADEARRLVDSVLAVATARSQTERGVFREAVANGPHILLVLDERVAPPRTLVSQLLTACTGTAISVIWLGSRPQDLPGECALVAELAVGVASLRLSDAQSGAVTENVTADGLPLDVAREWARALAPLRDTSASRGRASVPRSVALLDLLDAPELDEQWVARTWLSSADHLGAIVGADADGPVVVDLRYDGPHALVAGTTGAGKSELLQSLVASFAATHPPTRITFLLVDYKGGAAFKECVKLPHTVGFVTDLDEHLTQRALVSLNAELKRREEILRDFDAKDLMDLERKDPAAAPPSLLIVIDEFATLAKEVPDFVAGVVDVAQRGRSLGVHLLLATQRPGGVVSDSIRANTNLRIALRVSDPSESSDVIASPDAARIPRELPGRGYVRTGHSELRELQSAYVGGVTRLDEGNRISVRDLGASRRVPTAANREQVQVVTDLERIVAATREAFATAGLPDPKRPWLDPLPEVLAIDPDWTRSAGHDGVAIIGVVDEPTLQRQRPYPVDLEQDGSVLIYGASGSGKTSFLRALAVSLASAASPDDLHLYALDFASRALSGLDELPHCGAMVVGEDEERVTRLLGMLRRSVDERKELFARHGVFTLSEFRRAAGESLPRIVTLLDGYAGFTSAYERVNGGELLDLIPRLIADGRPLGVHFVVTADRRGAIPGSLTGIVPRKIVLRMADADEYVSLGIDARVARGASLPPGRGFVENRIELQCATIDVDVSGEAQAAALSRIAADLVARHGDSRAPAVGTLPTLVRRTEASQFGISDATLQPVSVDLALGHFLVVGPYRSGRSTALATLAEAATGFAEMHLLAPRRSPLVELGLWTSVAQGEGCADAAAALAERAEAGEALLVVVDDGTELAEGAAATALERIVKAGREGSARVVASVEAQGAHRAYGGWIRELRKEEHGILLSPQVDVDGDLFGVRLPRRTGAAFPPGRGFLVCRGTVELVQTSS